MDAKDRNSMQTQDWVGMFVDETSQCSKLVKAIRKIGFFVTTMPQQPLQKPELLFRNRTYRGVEQIQRFIDGGYEAATSQPSPQ